MDASVDFDRVTERTHFELLNGLNEHNDSEQFTQSGKQKLKQSATSIASKKKNKNNCSKQKGRHK